MASIYVFGIRHHGPGSARSLRTALEALRPDAILIEGPPDAAEVLPLAARPDMQPPVALLVYVPAEPLRAAHFPFAVFSPEWQALQYGLERGLPVRFIDLPQAHQLALAPASASAPVPRIIGDEPPATAASQPAIHEDPLAWLAAAAGYDDGERWWEHMVEERRAADGLFEGILEAMSALRQAAGPDPISELEAQREAYMRQAIRTAEREGFARVAVVCGAWHAPALADRPSAKRDQALLKGLPRVKVAATWVPWTYGRLALTSGYGAGIRSPGWYAHLWQGTDHIAERWLARVAHLLRAHDLDASPASVVEAVRLAEALAALRGRPLPGLAELNEATRAVLCHGENTPMRLIARDLIVGEALGSVPETTPQVPLQEDLLREQRRLRLKPEPAPRDIDLDLRQPTGLDRSRLLHRLNLLGIPWGQAQPAARGQRGTFHELWRLQWQPEFAVALVEASRWGSTLAAAAAAQAQDLAQRTADLAALTTLLDQTLLADLPEAAHYVVTRVQAESALSNDVGRLMDALPPLANILRYGDVRQTEAGLVGPVIDGLLRRICVGLPNACASLDDAAANLMFERLLAVHDTVVRLQQDDQQATWTQTLWRLADQAGLHGLLAGRCCRLLFDGGTLEAAELARRLRLALSPAAEPAQAAAWVEGLLRGSGLLLLHDTNLWAVLDAWLTQLPGETFIQVLPLLRRTFATFSAPERRQMGERARHGRLLGTTGAAVEEAYDLARAAAMVPLIAQLLGLAPAEAEPEPPDKNAATELTDTVPALAE